MPDTTDRVTTAEQLAAMPADGKRYELVDGVLRMMSPAGSEHGRIASELLLQIGQHAKQHKLGRTYAAETGFLIQRDPDTVLAPDASFVSNDRLAGWGGHRGYLPLAPDLVAEVVSRNDRTKDVADKAQAWLDAGVIAPLKTRVVGGSACIVLFMHPAFSAAMAALLWCLACRAAMWCHHLMQSFVGRFDQPEVASNRSTSSPDSKLAKPFRRAGKRKCGIPELGTHETCGSYPQ
ncbi:MAG: Uma2 family endonuclease, partial [Pirellulaceae bacterium]|nr:Uma2 family endonuclease [Pirellulaceae bacterium]